MVSSPLVAEEIQIVRTTGERTYRIRDTASPFDMAGGLSRIGPLRKNGNGILGMTLRISGFGDSNPTGNSAIVFDRYPAERRFRPVGCSTRTATASLLNSRMVLRIDPISFMPDSSMTIPSSQRARRGTLWPPPRDRNQ